MSRPPLARERVLDAFEAILLEDGERAATLEAVAKATGVSKGGLLYHFASKDDLAAGLIARLHALTDEDIDRIREADEGPVAYYIRTSVMEDDALDRALVATSRLAQGGSAEAAEALRDVRLRWADVIRPHVRDEVALDLVMLVSDGLYFNNSLGVNGERTAFTSDGTLSQLVELVQRAVDDSRVGQTSVISI